MFDIKSILDKINKSIVDEEDINRVADVMRSGFLSKPDGGPLVTQFQELMSRAHGMKYAFAVNSGTSALHCAIAALELKEGDEVIVPALANIADASVIIQSGGKPVFADIDSNDFNISPEKIEEKITGKTRAIILVHMYGQPGKINEIKKIAKENNLILIEDCAQAAGAKYQGKYVGSFGDISCFSLYQTKHIICGEGGVVATNNKGFAQIITSIANNGIMKSNLDAYDYDRIGFNYQLTEIQAALVIGQFNKLDKNNAKRRQNVQKFKELLRDVDIKFQRSEDNTENSYFYLTALLPENMADKRDEFIKQVQGLQSPIKKLYPLALTEMTLFKDKVKQDCLVAQNITKRIFNLYVNPGLGDEEIAFMAEAVKNAHKSIFDKYK